MTIHQAFEEFINSMEFKEIAKAKKGLGSKYRVYLTRFKRDQLKAGAMVEILIANGYEVTASKVRKKN